MISRLVCAPLILISVATAPKAASADSASGQMGNPQGLPEMFATWTVTKVLCENCEGKATPEIGSKIVIGNGGFQDPFSVTCTAGVSYPNRELGWETAQKLFALPPAADQLAPEAGQVVDARLDCGGGPVARVLFLGGGRAIYLAEAEDYLIVRQGGGS